MYLRFEGKARFLRQALRRFRMETSVAGTVAHDVVNRRRMHSMLRDASLASLRSEILGHPGGDAA